MKKTIRELINNYPEMVITAVQQSNSYAEALDKLGIASTNTSARKSLKNFLVDNGHGLPQYNRNHNRIGKQANNKLSKEDVLKRLIAGEKHIGSAVRRWVIEYELLTYACSTESCLLSDKSNLSWNGKQIVLDLDHISGDNTDNRLENLRFLCPNCHSQTDTYKGKNKRNAYVSIEVSNDFYVKQERYDALPSEEKLKEEIESMKYKTAVAGKYGVSVYALNLKLKGLKFNDNPAQASKIEWPELEEIIHSVKNQGWEKTSSALGVSGNAIRKHLKARKVDVKLIKTPFNTGPKIT